jgi:4-amino-4-deoxy-L-arabinose transferase-like glycosyltransferase
MIDRKDGGVHLVPRRVHGMPDDRFEPVPAVSALADPVLADPVPESPVSQEGVASDVSPVPGDIRDLAPATVRNRLALVALLVGTSLTYLWSLDRNGWANTYYAAAVQAGVHSWKAFFFASFDAGNFITVDKPPVSLWVMALSGRLFGFSSWSMLVPQVLLGVGSVALLYAVVRRVWGPSAGLLAGVGLAVTPVAALMFRFNNPDAALTFLLVLGAWTLTCALERGRIWWLLATGVALGFAFLTKELQALLVLPGFAVTYLVAGPPRLVVRVGQLLAAGAVLVVSGLWWPVLVDAISAADRPYIGGSTTNSVLELAFGFNGLGRITGNGNGNGAGPGPFPGGRSARRTSSKSARWRHGWTRFGVRR